jgi:hypothetical protein
MVESDVYETFFSFVNVTCYLRFIKCPVVWQHVMNLLKKIIYYVFIFPYLCCVDILDTISS